RGQGYRSRQIEPKNFQLVIRSQDCLKDIATNPTEMGSVNNRHVCCTRESPTPNVLELSTRSILTSNRRFPPTMDKTRPLLLPTVETHPLCITQNQTRQDTENSINYSILDSSTLVANTDKDDTIGKTNFLPTQPMDDDRLAIIRETQKETGLVDESIDFLTKSTRKSTNKSYNRQWKKYVQWCKQQTPVINPRQYSPINVFNYLIHQRHLSTSHLKIIRAAITSVYKTLHPTKGNLAEEKLIADFFKSKRQQTVCIPKQHQLTTWDSNDLLTFILHKYKDTQTLTLSDLQQKTLLLLALSTMARPRSDLGQLQHRDVLFESNNESQVTKMTLHFQQLKETQVKTIQLQCLSNQDICPTTTTFLFLQRSSHLRQNLPIDHTLFLSYIEDTIKTRSARPTMIANWIKAQMQDAGINTQLYKPYSIHSASSTKAVEQGHSISSVKEHGNWSRKADTFERYYYKPINSTLSSTQIAQSILHNTENCTTLEVRAEATEVGLGMTSNQYVAEAKTENVIRPSQYVSWFQWLKGTPPK
ncbi:hypothetical protein INT45_003293, partial [Circinella minor]